MKKRIVIIGATSTIAEYCAREWMKQDNIELFLVGRNEEQLKRIAADLQVRAPQNQSQILTLDFNVPEAIKTITDNICLQGVPGVVLIAQGALPDQKQCEENLTLSKEILEINAISPVLFAEAFAAHMDRVDSGTIAIIGSVAGDRGRRSNYTYGAAKSLVAQYAQGLQHRFYKRKVNIILVKPGPTLTKMTLHLKERGRFAQPKDVAMLIVQGVAKGKPVIYAPKYWRLVMLIMRSLPGYIFNKMNI